MIDQILNMPYYSHDLEIKWRKDGVLKTVKNVSELIKCTHQSNVGSVQYNKKIFKTNKEYMEIMDQEIESVERWILNYFALSYHYCENSSKNFKDESVASICNEIGLQKHLLDRDVCKLIQVLNATHYYNYFNGAVRVVYGD